MNNTGVRRVHEMCLVAGFCSVFFVVHSARGEEASVPAHAELLMSHVESIEALEPSEQVPAAVEWISSQDARPVLEADGIRDSGVGPVELAAFLGYWQDAPVEKLRASLTTHVADSEGQPILSVVTARVILASTPEESRALHLQARSFAVSSAIARNKVLWHLAAAVYADAPADPEGQLMAYPELREALDAADTTETQDLVMAYYGQFIERLIKVGSFDAVHTALHWVRVSNPSELTRQRLDYWEHQMIPRRLVDLSDEWSIRVDGGVDGPSGPTQEWRRAVMRTRDQAQATADIDLAATMQALLDRYTLPAVSAR